MINNQENRDFCTEQLDRLSGTAFFDELSEVATQELAGALLSAADCQEQAREIVTKWHRDGNRRAPTPGDIYTAAQKLQKPVAAVVLPDPCANCADTPGFVHFEVIQKFGMFAGESRSASDFCKCPLGDVKRAAAKRYQQEPRPKADFVSTKESIGDLLG